MVNIDKLLKQKGWTGEELGILEITNFLEAAHRTLEGDIDVQPRLSKNELWKMINSLDRSETMVYNNYIKIHEWVGNMYSTAISQEQQAQARFNSLIYYATNADTGEQLYQYVAQLPTIMTEKQYNEMREQRLQEILHPDGGGIGFNVFSLINEAIEYYVNQLQKNPRKKNPLQPLKEKLENELVTDPRILSRYNEVMENGYYTLADGRRSDQMTAEEWQKAITTPKMEKALEQMRATDGAGKQYTLTIAQQRLFDRAKVIFNGGTEEDADEAQQQKDYEQGLAVPAEWHYYEEPPKDLTKWEIIEAGELPEYYRSLNDLTPEGEEIPTDKYEEYVAADAAAFKKEFPELAAAILKDMEEKKIQGIPANVEDWGSVAYDWEDLYNQDYYGFRENYTSDAAILGWDKRACINGIAIIRPGLEEGCLRIDKNGYYNPPEIRKLISTFSLEAFFTDSEDYVMHTNIVEGDRQVLIESLYWLHGYNTALDLIKNHFGIEALDYVKIDTSGLENQIEALNSFIIMLYKKIKDTDYEDKEEQAKKLEVLKDILYPIDLEETVIPDNKIAIAKSYLPDFAAFKKSEYELSRVLCFKNKRGVGFGAK